MNHEAYFDTHYEQMVRWKHAVIGDYVKECKVSKFPFLHGKITVNNGSKIKVTLEKCECGDFQKRRKPCTHMMTLAIKTGIYDKIKDVATEKIRNLSDRAYEAFAYYLYYGYYEDSHKAEKWPQKTFREIQDQGLIDYEKPEFRYSQFTQENIIAIIYATYSDPRNKM